MLTAAIVWVCTSLLQEQERLFDDMQAQGIPLRYTHCMAHFMPNSELAYAEQLAKLAAGTPSNGQQTSPADMPAKQHCQHTAGHCQWQPPPLIQMPGWLAALAKATSGSILGRPDTFRCDVSRFVHSRVLTVSCDSTTG